MQVSIEGDVQAVLRDLGFTLPRISKAAEVTALNATTRKIATAFRRGLSAETGIQQKILSTKFRRYGATRSKPRSRVWYGLGTRIPVSAVLKGKKRKLPAKLDRYIDLTGAASQPFNVSVNGRAATLMYRTGAGRFPIKAVKLDLSTAARRVMRTVAPPIAAREFPRQFRRDLKRRLAGFSGRAR